MTLFKTVGDGWTPAARIGYYKNMKIIARRKDKRPSLRSVWAAFKETDRKIQAVVEQMKETDRKIQEVVEQMKETDRKIAELSKETDRKIAELSKETDRKIAELSKETDRQMKETDRQMKETDRQMKETDRQMKETAKQMKETDRQMKETAKQMKETDRKIAELSKNIGGLTNSLGGLIEALFAGNPKKLFTQAGYEFDKVYLNHKFEENGQVVAEADIALVNTSAEKDYAMLVEVKTKLTCAHVNDHLERIAKIRNYRDRDWHPKTLMGAVAGGVINEYTIQYAHQHGLYVLVQSGDTVTLATPPENFTPKKW
ncbi:MAG: methyl-accepting chemotaxis protein [Spirochaetaceae bacterium]|jgi:myosin heavy subunit|nr:methyl-accepting chemotaxis protein [Spirochaetaceae bacterium]